MTGKSEDLRQVKPDPLHPKLLNGGFEEDSDNDGFADHWHYQRQTRLATDGVAEGKMCLVFENTEAGRLSQGLQATAVDGSKIGSLQFALKYKTDKAKSGSENYEQPAMVVHFYDDNRRSFENVVIGPWTGTHSEWTSVNKTITVPPKTREMIVRIGLNGGTGTLWLDEIRMTSMPRN